MYLGMFFVPVAAIAPRTSAPQWIRTEELRTETSSRPSFTASIASGIASTLPSLMSRPAFLMTLDEVVFPQLGRLVDVPFGAVLGQKLDVRVARERASKSLGALSRSAVTKSTLGHDHIARPADGLEKRFGDRFGHRHVVRLEEGDDAGVVLGDDRIHLDDRDALLDHLRDWIDQRVDAERLNGHEVPHLGRHVVDGFALLVDAEPSVVPGDVDAEPLAPLFGCRFALRRPRVREARVDEGGFERFAERVVAPL